MSSSNGLNVLVEAKKEYLHQLTLIVCPIMIETFQDIYNQAKKISKGKKILLHFQGLLKEVVNWNNHMVKQHSDKICNSCAWFNDLMAALFVSYVKIFSAVRLNTSTKKISIKLPSNDVFIHGCYINAAKDIYKDPYIFHDEMTDYEREEKLNARIISCVENTIKEMVPVHEILKTYMSQDRVSQDLDVMSEVPSDTEDPDIDDDPLPDGAEPDPEPAEPEGPVEPEGPEETTEGPEGPEGPEDETKNIDMNKKTDADDEGVLFPDAPDQ
jgi:hypothetical protein